PEEQRVYSNLLFYPPGSCRSRVFVGPEILRGSYRSRGFPFRACLNFIDGIYYEAILERNKENFAGIVGHYGEKFNAVAAQNSHNKAIE
ncbi:hypothetical protein, partial [Niabella drilacis]